MNGPVATVDGVFHLSKSLLRHPVPKMLWFELQKLLPRKEGAFWVASEVAIVSKSHQIAQTVLIRGVPGHVSHVAYFKRNVERRFHLRYLAVSHCWLIRLPPC